MMLIDNLRSLLRTNKYDDEEIEYWVDHRTLGQRGTEQKSGTLTETSQNSRTEKPAAACVDVSQPLSDAERARQARPGLQVETGNCAGALLFMKSKACQHSTLII